MWRQTIRPQGAEKFGWYRRAGESPKVAEELSRPPVRLYHPNFSAPCGRIVCRHIGDPNVITSCNKILNHRHCWSNRPTRRFLSTASVFAFRLSGPKSLPCGSRSWRGSLYCQTSRRGHQCGGISMKFLTHNTPVYVRGVVLSVHAIVRVQVYCMLGISYLYRHTYIEQLKSGRYLDTHF